MYSSKSAPSRRAYRACGRCRKRKRKCDLKFPTCTPCLNSGEPCHGSDAQSENDTPRSLIRSLEEEVSQLEEKLKRIPQNGERANSDAATRIAEATFAAGMPTPGPFFSNSRLSTFFLTPSLPPLLIYRSTSFDIQFASTRKSPYELFLSLVPPHRPPIGLRNIPAKARDRLIQHYTSTLTHQYPIVDSVEMNNVFQHVSQTQSELRLTHFELYVAYMILAISSAALSWKINPRDRTTSLSLFSSAIQHLQQITEVPELTRLQAVLLLAHYAHVNPEIVDAWVCISNAVSIVSNLSLHREPTTGMNASEKQMRHRLFWVTYNMDRSLSSMLRLPVSFPEQCISLEVDKRVLIDPSSQTSAQRDDNMTYYRSVEIEVHRVLHLKEDTPNLVERGLTGWISDVSSSLEEWYIATSPAAPNEIVLFRHLLYNYLKAKIYRPTPRIPTRTATDRQMCFDVCQRIIESGNTLFESKALTYSWQTVHILFGAVVILLEACWQYRTQPLMRPSAIHVLSVLIPQCLDFLGEIGKEWGNANLCKICLHSMLEEVVNSYNSVTGPGVMFMAHDATTEKLRNLLFADRLPSDNMLSNEAALDLEAEIMKDPMYSWDLEDIEWSSWC